MRIGPGIGIGGRRGGASGPAPTAFLGQSINAAGWSATYASPPTFTPDSNPERFTVTRQGYNSIGVPTTFAENLICTSRTRQVHPNHANLTTDQISLSDYVYAADTVLGATNNSLEDSPKPIANWTLPDRRVVGNSLTVRFTAWHRNARNGEQIASAKLTATDGTNTVTQYVSASSLIGLSDYANPTIEYVCTFDITSLNDNAAITVGADIYPHVGVAASVLSTTEYSAFREFRPQVYLKNVSLAANPVYVYVATGGNDTTGAVSTNAATAEASPCLSIRGAINRANTVNGRLDGVEIRLTAGTWAWSSSAGDGTRTQDIGEIVITRDPNVSKAAAIFTFGSVLPYVGTAGAWFRLFDITVTRTATNGWQGQGASPVVTIYDRVVFNNAGFTSAICASAIAFASHVAVDFTGSTTPPINVASHPCFGLIIGCTGPAPGNTDQWCLLGNTFTTMVGVLSTSTGTTTARCIVAFNEFLTKSNINGITAVTAAQFVFAQNVIEHTALGIGAQLLFSADSATQSLTHVICVHNTLTGFFSLGRGNLFYDDGPTPRAHKLFSMVGNIHVQLNTKGDVFMSNGARTGNFAYLYAPGCNGEFTQFIDAQNGGLGTSFAQVYQGIRASVGTSNATRNDPLFVNYQSLTSGPTAGAGGGNYRIAAGSPAKSRAAPVLKWDLDGTLRSTTLASAGAYE